MHHRTHAPLLRFALWLDAVASTATGLGLCVFTERLAQVLSLPAALLGAAGVFCVAYGLALAWLARRGRSPGVIVPVIVAGNLLWATDCALLATGFALPSEPSAMGVAFLLAQALAVAGLAALQFAGLKRSPRASVAVLTGA